MHTVRGAVICACIAVIALGAQAPAELVIVNGRVFTGAAYAERREGEKGTLAPGQLADLAILSQDIFRVPLPDLPTTFSVLTIVGGRVVHESR